MNLIYDDFKNGSLLYQGKIVESINYAGSNIFKLDNEEFFQRTDSHFLPYFSPFPNIEIYNIIGKFVLVFPENECYTYIEKITVIESQTTEQFTGFEPNKAYELQNGQIWQQIDGPISPVVSAGHVKIINESLMIVDNLSSKVQVFLIKG